MKKGNKQKKGQSVVMNPRQLEVYSSIHSGLDRWLRPGLGIGDNQGGLYIVIQVNKNKVLVLDPSSGAQTWITKDNILRGIMMGTTCKS